MAIRSNSTTPAHRNGFTAICSLLHLPIIKRSAHTRMKSLRHWPVAQEVSCTNSQTRLPPCCSPFTTACCPRSVLLQTSRHDCQVFRLLQCISNHPPLCVQISAFGSAGSSDTGDIWILEWDKSKSTWEQDQPIKFKHQDTGSYLSSHSKKFNRPITGQQEVCAKAKSKDANWLATEGVYFPPQAQ